MEETDFEGYRRLQDDASVKEFTRGSLPPVSKEYYRRVVSTLGSTCMAVCTKNDGRFIGTCGFRPADWGIGLEIFLLPETQRKGFGTELFDAMISHCAIDFPNAKIGASVLPSNSAALKLLASRGFQDTGKTIPLKSGIEESIYVKSS